MSRIRNRLITGLLTILPALFTIWILLLLVRLTDSFFQPLFLLLFNRPLPGAGLVLTPILLYLIGTIVQNQLSGRVLHWLENMFGRIPVIGTIYFTARQTIESFNLTADEQKFSRVVFVQYPRQGVWALGFVTREMQFLNEKSVTLFMPTTPNPTSGVLIVVAEKDTIRTSMTIEEAAKFVISGGILAPGGLKTLAERVGH